MSPPPLLNCLWIGPRLTVLERACIRSAQRVGHEVRLWCYDEPEGVPEGVTLADASEILPRDAITRHKSGSVALFANWFRYELQRRGEGIWVDADHYFLKAIALPGPYLLALEAPQMINNGILRLPAGSPLLPELIAPFDRHQVPGWLPLRHRIAAHVRKLRTGRPGLSEMPWGSLGPKALTATARRHGLFHLAAPPALYSPVPWQQAQWVSDPRRSLDEYLSSETVAVHLWNELIKDRKEAPAAPGSFLARIQREGA
jgi:hypothetical protein